uniref:steroid 11beta-monooxygenase n=1 Tax=Chelonoidis abingdonii TaxID=106734 RepID=A0A8C0JI31_CHEAB
MGRRASSGSARPAPPLGCLPSGAARSSRPRPGAGPGPAAAARPLPYEAIPRSGRNAWLSLYRLWRSNSFQRFHLRNFQRLGPIYRCGPRAAGLLGSPAGRGKEWLGSARGWQRIGPSLCGDRAEARALPHRETIGTYNCVNVLLPRDAAQLFQSEGIFPRRMGIESWIAHRQLRNHKCGIFLLARPGTVSLISSPAHRNGEEWRSDRLILNKEVISPAGTRKFLPFLNAVAQDFVTLMHRRISKNTRCSLTIDLYGDLFRFTLEASSYALYGERLGLLEESPNAESQRFISAVETMLRTTLPLLFIPPGLMRWVNTKLWRDHIEAWDTIFKHGEPGGRGHPPPYEGVGHPGRVSCNRPQGATAGDALLAMSGPSLDSHTQYRLACCLLAMSSHPGPHSLIPPQGVKGTASSQCASIGRLYPVGITVQRYPTKDVVLQNYCVPAGTLCQVGLYAMGRSPEVFSNPERYDPLRWLSKEDNSFKALAFGFGARQCIGRRLAETEMMLFLMHVLRNFRIDTVSKADIKTVFGFILMPEKPPLLTFRPID